MLMFIRAAHLKYMDILTGGSFIPEKDDPASARHKIPKPKVEGMLEKKSWLVWMLVCNLFWWTLWMNI